MKAMKKLYDAYLGVSDDGREGFLAGLSLKEREKFSEFINKKQEEKNKSLWNKLPTVIHLTNDMFALGKPFAQGEVLIWKKEYAPKGVLAKLAALKNMQEMKLENGQMILGHSESGHFHVLEPVAKKSHISKAAQALIDSTNDMLVELKLFEDCRLVHMREFDTHKAVVLPPGEYIRCIREEQTVQGWVRVQD